MNKLKMATNLLLKNTALIFETSTMFALYHIKTHKHNVGSTTFPTPTVRHHVNAAYGIATLSNKLFHSVQNHIL